MQKKAKTIVDAMLTRSREGRLVEDYTLSGRRKVGKRADQSCATWDGTGAPDI